jgi:hypothetical protein
VTVTVMVAASPGATRATVCVALLPPPLLPTSPLEPLLVVGSARGTAAPGPAAVLTAGMVVIAPLAALTSIATSSFRVWDTRILRKQKAAASASATGDKQKCKNHSQVCTMDSSSGI